jgi:hypothetical protein
MQAASLAEWGYVQQEEWTPENSVTPGQNRPWLPFTVQNIRLFGNNKSNIGPRGKEYGRRNVTELGINLDTVRGCSFAAVHGFRGCYGNCYLAESMVRYHIKYWIPVSMRLNPCLLVKDLQSIRSDYVRNGVNGDPSFDWDLSVRVAELCDTYDKTTVLPTRFGIEPSDIHLRRLARVECIMHGSLSAIDPPRHRERVLSSLDRYEALGGRPVRRVITAWFNDEQSALWEVQDRLMSMGKAFQQPLRIRGQSPVNALLDLSRYGPTVSNTDGRLTNRWKSAGDTGYGSRGCYSHCYECPNQCMSKVALWRGR